MSDRPHDARQFPPSSQPSAGDTLATALTKTHAVPKRFGISGIMAVTAGMAILFAVLRLLRVPPLGFLFVGLMAVVICAAQMVWGKVPRLASCLAGAGLLTVVVFAAVISQGAPPEALPSLFVTTLAFGAAFGYVMGTLFAGVFVVMANIDPFLPGGRDRARKPVIPQTGTVAERDHEQRSDGEDAFP